MDEGYFATMGIPIDAGRSFRATDTFDAPRVAIVNDMFARRYWPGRDPIGKRFKNVDDGPAWIEIVGVAHLSKYGYAGEPPQDAVYFPFRQHRRSSMTLLVQTAGDSAALVSPLRDMLHAMDVEVPAYDAQTIESFYEARVSGIGSVIINLILTMGVMGMALTMVGLYGLVSYAVSRRTREIGIRIAIGAGSGRILRMVLREGMMPAWFGLAAGLALSAATTRVLNTLTPIGHRYDPRTFFLVVPLLLAVTLLAAFVPARRAARVSPTVALRCD